MQENPRAKKRSYVIIVAAVLVVILTIGAFLYYITAQQHKDRFPAHTYINSIDVSNMTASRGKKALAAQAEEYTLKITERNGACEYITADDIGLTYTDNGDVDALLTQYDPYHWPIDQRRTDVLTAAADTTFDTELAESAINSLRCFSDYTPMSNAALDDSGTYFSILPEVEGTELDADAAKARILAALENRESELDLESEGLYLSPTVLSDDPALNAKIDELNSYLDACITFDFEDGRIVTVDASVIHDWVAEDEDGNLSLSYDAAFNFVKTKMAYQTDTFGLTHTFTTHSGATIQLKEGDYGWCIARDATTQKILNAVEEGYVGEMEPEYLYSAMNRGIDDIGGTYVEVSISEQMMWCYKDYELVVATPVVTGNVSRGNGTPYGSVWAIDAKKRDAVLGTLDTMGYESPVEFWMPFHDNVGIHDADGWRTEYGGSIYLTNGSHGCVNTPRDAAEQIFNTVSIGTAVVVYDLTDLDADGVKDAEQVTTDEIKTDADWDWDD